MKEETVCEITDRRMQKAEFVGKEEKIYLFLPFIATAKAIKPFLIAQTMLKPLIFLASAFCLLLYFTS